MGDETTEVLRRIATQIREKQRTAGLSTTEMAARSTILPAELEPILRGEVDIPLHRLYLIAGALRVRPASLLAGIEWVPTERGGGHFRVVDA